MLKSIKSFVHLNRRETLMNILVCDDNESFVLELTEKIHHSCICLGSQCINYTVYSSEADQCHVTI